MALVAVKLISNNTSVDATSFALGSATYTSGRYYLLFCTNTKGSAADAVNSVTNSQVTFSATNLGNVQYSTSASKLKRLSLFGGACSSTGASDTTVDYNSVTQTGFNGVVIEITGHNTTTPIVVGSYSTNVADSVGSGTTFTVTTPAVASSLNAIVAGFAQDNNGVMSPQASFLELEDAGHGTPANRLAVAWLINGDDPGYTRAAVADWGGLAVEINEASVGGAATHAHSKIWGFSKLHGLVN